MKAFLSHSSRDKELVRAIAKELGRQFCIFDEQVFSTGDEFKKSIEQKLDESTSFVLFASKSALESVWVNFEIDEAWYMKLRNKLSKSLVYLIDSSITANDLPEWLRRALIRREKSPKIIARDIRHHLDELLIERQHPYFVGRTRDVEELEQAVTPLHGAPPRVFFITGLPGIGRRSLLRHASPNILNLRKQLEIRLGEGDSINDICITIADYVEPYATKEGFERIVKEIRRLNANEAIQRILANLRALISAGELPLFLDEGGLLDNEGYLREPIQAILRSLAPDDRIYLFFISHRRPQIAFEQSYPVVSLKPLEDDEVKRLILTLANRDNLHIPQDAVSELAHYIAGYPPAAYFSIQQAKYYGFELVNREKTRLVQFRTAVFLRHLARFSFQEFEQNLLKVLAVYSPLPLAVLSQVLNVELAKIHESMIRLIDLSLIVTTEQGFYRIADPVVDASLKAFGYPTDSLNKAVAHNLAKFLKTSEIDSSRLSLSRVVFRAASLSGEQNIAETALHLANDLIRLSETLYHERKYMQVIEYGKAALNERPDNTTARSFLIRALIQEERWEEAEEQLRELQRYAPIKEVYFLRGFLERKRGRPSLAIEHYKKAEQSGRRGAAISRELSLCYLLAGDHEQASKYINEALDRHGDDPYVVDLWVQIALRQGDEATARRALSRLEVIDDPNYYYHRLARVEFTFGNLPAALAAARQAVEGATTPHFETLANLIYCEIEAENLETAEELLTKLDRQFGNLYRDIRVGLRCRLEISRDKYSEALLQSERIREKNTIFYKRIRYDALLGELTFSVLKDEIRTSYQQEFEELGKTLAGQLSRPFTYIDIDQF